MGENGRYETHDFCDLFPRIPTKQLTELAQDIKANGQRESIWIFEGKILDGKNRESACFEAGVEPKYKDFTGNESQALAFSISKNMQRRDLSPGERARIAAKANKFKMGRPESAPNGALKTQAQAAKEVGVSKRTIQRAVQVEASKVEAKAKPKPKPEPEAPKKSPAEQRLETASEEAERMKELSTQLLAIERELLEICRTPTGAFMNGQSIECDLEHVRTCIKFAIPYALCAYCGGDKCKACRQQGWMPKVTYEQAPRELQIVK